MDLTRRDIHSTEVPALCRSCEVRHKGMCGALNPDELLLLSRHTRQLQHGAGEELVGESTSVEAYDNIMRGVVKLSKTLEDGRQQIVGLQFAPDLVGRLYASESPISAQAASEVDVCRVPKVTLERLIERNPALRKRLMDQSLRELDDARDWMVTLGRKTAAEKVASLLLVIALHLDPDAKGEVRIFDLPVTRLDMADYLGLTIETVSRQFSRLKREGILSITANRHIEVMSLTRLKARCG
ncbi:Crp/Fnr family transcriptional regulator [Rhizobium sp. SSA_523]|uniref:Crp/Fnr family transcriptional regulator n=1 Tax=Rhizobium sp. SSA_523 TaxID=2952477 RepID=UPI0020917807|nr:Crp/Fnr family transcriptional regulator [Rhizobium sp. SSA_523]MCO5732587.1 Crp/Fnr family transcriptional regulator [Rhizobium sp. SSA_523]WKC23774.1 Crp/Fnr family transcriptional regulator [Rhizobium sp. SSA_523]